MIQLESVLWRPVLRVDSHGCTLRRAQALAGMETFVFQDCVNLTLCACIVWRYSSTEYKCIITHLNSKNKYKLIDINTNHRHYSDILKEAVTKRKIVKPVNGSV